VVLAVVLGLVAIIARTIFSLPAVRQFGRAKLRRRWDLDSNFPGPDKQVSPIFSEATVPASHTHTVRTRLQPIDPRSSDTTANIEASVRRLLQELKQREHQRRFPMEAAQSSRHSEFPVTASEEASPRSKEL
jgi:hypothetical protein